MSITYFELFYFIIFVYCFEAGENPLGLYILSLVCANMCNNTRLGSFFSKSMLYEKINKAITLQNKRLTHLCASLIISKRNSCISHVLVVFYLNDSTFCEPQFRTPFCRRNKIFSTHIFYFP